MSSQNDSARIWSSGRKRCTFFFLWLTIFLPVLSQAQGYRYAVIAFSGGPLDGVLPDNFFGFDSVGLSIIGVTSSGDVIYRAASETNAAIFRNKTAIVRQGQTIAGRTLTNLGYASASDGGVAFNAEFAGGGSGIVRGTSLLVERGQTVGGVLGVGGLTLTGAFHFSPISSNGAVAWMGQASEGVHGVFRDRTLLAQAGPRLPLQSVSSPACNGLNQCVWEGTLPRPQTVLDPPGGHFIYSEIGPLYPDGRLPVINNRGQVAYYGPGGIYRNNTLIARPGTIIGGQEVGFDGVLNQGMLAINDSGTVVFFAPLASGGDAIFTQTEVVAKKGTPINRSCPGLS